MRESSWQAESLYKRPISIRHIGVTGEIEMTFSSSLSSTYLLSEAEQISLMNDLLKVKDAESAISFLSISGEFPTRQIGKRITQKTGEYISKIDLPLFLSVSKSFQFLFDLAKMAEQGTGDISEFIFGLEPGAEFSGNAVDIRKARKATKERLAGERSHFGFAPSPIVSDFNFYMLDDSGTGFAPIPWDLLLMPLFARGKGARLLAAGCVETVININLDRAHRCLSVETENHKSMEPIFTIGELVSDPWTAVHMGLMKVLARVDEYRMCPHPKCKEIFKGRTDKVSCGSAKCRQFVTRRSGGR